MRVAPEAVLRIILGTACAIVYNIIDVGDRMESIESLFECVVHSALARVSCKLRVVRHR